MADSPGPRPALAWDGRPAGLGARPTTKLIFCAPARARTGRLPCCFRPRGATAPLQPCSGGRAALMRAGAATGGLGAAAAAGLKWWRAAVAARFSSAAAGTGAEFAGCGRRVVQKVATSCSKTTCAPPAASRCCTQRPTRGSLADASTDASRAGGPAQLSRISAKPLLATE